jgi:hypothetical protein
VQNWNELYVFVTWFFHKKSDVPHNWLFQKSGL